ncbi:MAG: DUF3971 domain-containing protein [Pseudomonadota bacterium]
MGSRHRTQPLAGAGAEQAGMMQGPQPSPEDGSEPGEPAPRRVRSWLRWVALGAKSVGVLVLAGFVAVAVVLIAARGDGIALPEGLQARVLERVNAGLASALNPEDLPDGPRGEIVLETISVALPEGGFYPEIRLSSVQFRDAVGLRAFFPEMGVLLNGGALLGGNLRVQRVRLDGAGMQLARDETGAIDLRLAPEAPRQQGGISATLANFDALWDRPAFAELDEISGQGLLFLVNDVLTGQIIQSRDADLSLSREGEVLRLVVDGALVARREARVRMEITRDAARAQTRLEARFQTLDAQDLASASPALGWLAPIDAPISGQLSGEIDDFGRVGDVAGRLEIGAGALSQGEAGDALAFDGLQAQVRYDAAASRLSFDTLALSAPAMDLRATGEAQISPDGEVFLGQLQLDELRVDPPGLFEQPLEFRGGALDLRLTLGTERRLEIGQAALFGGPFELRASGEVGFGPDGVVSALDLHLPEVAAREVLPYWPENFIPGTRAYLDQRMQTGRVRDLAVALRRAPDTAGRVAVRMDFDGLTLNALNGLPPIENGAGYLSVMDNRFVLRLAAGEITAPRGGAIDLAGSTMLIEELVRGASLAEFDFAIDGPLEAVGAVLAGPPVNLMAESRIAAADLARGRARVLAELDFPLQRQIAREDIRFRAAGTLNDVTSETLLEGRVLSAERLELSLSEEVVALVGRAALDGVPMTGRWSQALGPGADGVSRAEARVTVSDENLRRLGVGLPPRLLSGAGAVDAQLALRPGVAPDLTLSSDLAGLALSLPTLGWSLPQVQTGRLDAQVSLGAVPRIEALDLQAAGLALQGRVDLAPGGGLDRFELDRFAIGAWLSVRGALVGRGPGVPPLVEITGGSIDLARAEGLGGPSGATGSASEGPPIQAVLDRLVLSEGIVLTSVLADLAPGLSGNFRGRVNGGPDISGQLRPNVNGLDIDLQAGDAGAVLRAADLFANGYGGAMTLNLRAAPEPQSYRGFLDIDGMRVRDAPAVAELLNAISVVGLLDQLSGEGIDLSDIEARFRVTPEAIVIEESSAIGAAIGLSMDGRYETASGRYDVQGVVSPIYVINGALGAIFAPRREGLFGVSYQVTGQGDQATVTANPLSILTPGIFREIFRRPPPGDLSAQ